MAKNIKTRLNTRSFLAGFFVCALIAASATYVLKNALAGENNIDLLTAVLIPCSDEPIATSTRMVTLRLDDVQAYAFAQVSRRMIDDATAIHAPMVLAVIPDHLRDDFVTYKFLRANRCSIEFAVHGWDHKEPVPGRGEFAFLGEKEAERKIADGREVLVRLSRADVSTFIPPNNEYGTSTAEALVKLKFDRVSGYENGFLDVDTSMYDFTKHRFRSANAIVADCEARYAKGDPLCVIMLHPQDFMTGDALDESKYTQYTELLSALSAQHVTFVRFSDVVKRVPIELKSITTYSTE